MVTVTSVKPIEKSLEFSAFKNIHDLEPESDHKLAPFWNTCPFVWFASYYMHSSIIDLTE